MAALYQLKAGMKRGKSQSFGKWKPCCKGTVLYCVPGKVFRAHGRWLYNSSDKGESWQRVAALPSDIQHRLLIKSRLTRRLLRLGFHHVVPIKTGALAIANKGTYQLEKSTFRHLGDLVGSRPLSLCCSEDGVYYGEYRSNPFREPVRIWEFKTSGEKWDAVWTFHEVRHIHGIYKDPFDGDIWVTTGDDNHEAAIWRTRDRFSTLERIISGNQQTRAIKLLFTPNSVLFGSDTPEELNYIYQLDRSSFAIMPRQAVKGSVFHGCRVGEWNFFSTAVETSNCNTSNNVEIWASPDELTWKCIFKLKKDFLPKKLFQYGQVFFPAGTGDDHYLWMTPFATEMDQLSLRVSIKEIEERWYGNSAISSCHDANN